MSRYIDAEKVYPWYLESFKGEIAPNEVRFSMLDIDCNLLNIPTSDVVEVVRCRDCYYSVISKDGNRGCKYHELEVEDDDFCSMGERKDAVS